MPSRTGSFAQCKPFADGPRPVDENVPEEILHRKNLSAQINAPDAALPRHQMGGAENCIRVGTFAVVNNIFVGFRAAVDPLPPSGDVAVIMKLMNDGSKVRQIDNR